MKKKVLLENEFFKIEKRESTLPDGSPCKEVIWSQYKSTEDTCEELLRLYKLEKAVRNSN